MANESSGFEPLKFYCILIWISYLSGVVGFREEEVGPKVLTHFCPICLAWAAEITFDPSSMRALPWENLSSDSEGPDQPQYLQSDMSLHCTLTESLDTTRMYERRAKAQGPVVQSVVSLMSSLRVISLTVLADSIHNILIFFAEINVSSFCTAKATHIFSAKNFSIFAYHSM